MEKSNHEIRKDQFYPRSFQGEDGSTKYAPFDNGGERFEYSSELNGRIFERVTVKFSMDGEDAQFSGVWHGHIFTEDEISVLCDGGSITFDSVEGDKIYTVTGSLKKIQKEIDPFNVSFNSSYKLYNTAEYEFVPDVFPGKYVPKITEFDKKTLYIYNEGELVEMSFLCRELPDAAALNRLLGGGIIEVVGKEFSESGQPAAYYGYELKKASSKYGGCVIHYNDGSYIPLKNSLGEYRFLYERSLASGDLTVTLSSFSMPKDMDLKKVAEQLFDMDFLYDTFSSEVLERDLDKYMMQALRCPVRFSGVWCGHIFTPEEIGALSRGETVEFDYFDASGTLCRVKGGLEIGGLQCILQKESGSVLLDQYDIARGSSEKLVLPDYECEHEYYCCMTFVPDGGMGKFVPVAEKDQFESYDPDGMVPF
ncbi:hypothetical protein [Ruminococcus albus]|uniref:Uncharacterized protein n=1 Tax=Ruminococcus albus (strain ATCC 27210 / DSM 20455 / JCM 14654 / NCDO 2250 / 7) TaxID=697329 RepID=E6UIM4_RUMA7|nr:hypothetical protein [Ruminococcus albus]ADU23369.1 hypothetical protein Rumal_2903 [Ruminococcus albus 7 = DSM 20455]